MTCYSLHSKDLPRQQLSPKKSRGPSLNTTPDGRSYFLKLRSISPPPFIVLDYRDIYTTATDSYNILTIFMLVIYISSSPISHSPVTNHYPRRNYLVTLSNHLHIYIYSLREIDHIGISFTISRIEMKSYIENILSSRTDVDLVDICINGFSANVNGCRTYMLNQTVSFFDQ